MTQQSHKERMFDIAKDYMSKGYDHRALEILDQLDFQKQAQEKKNGKSF